jgi:ABC-type Mn2+/Zn2+ transport system ATPase subunit
MIEIRRVSQAFGNEAVLRNVTTWIGPGELLGIIGPSGAGKTTLLRILLGELTPTRGTVRSTSRTPIPVGYVPQLDAGERSFPLTVREMVLLGAASQSTRVPWFGRAEKRQASAILERLGILGHEHSRLDELSGGQFQRALIARALMAQPSLLILDEPTSGIDLRTRQHVLDLLEDLRQEGLSIVLSTHDLNWVAAHLPRIICLNRAVIADGAPIDVLKPNVVRATYGADMDVVLYNGRPVVVDAASWGSVA